MTGYLIIDTVFVLKNKCPNIFPRHDILKLQANTNSTAVTQQL